MNSAPNAKKPFSRDYMGSTRSAKTSRKSRTINANNSTKKRKRFQLLKRNIQRGRHKVLIKRHRKTLDPCYMFVLHALTRRYNKLVPMHHLLSENWQWN